MPVSDNAKIDETTGRGGAARAEEPKAKAKESKDTHEATIAYLEAKLERMVAVCDENKGKSLTVRQIIALLDQIKGIAKS